jgi:isopenicillin-N N-acyltransferase like protein
MNFANIRTFAILSILMLVVWVAPLQAEVLGRSGQGWLESIDGYPVLHVKGSPYEMGRQHGELLRDQVHKNLQNLLEIENEKAVLDIGPLRLKPRQLIETIIKMQEPFVPPKYFEELRGLADGAQVPLADVRVANFIPELFHCSGFA